MIRFVLGRLAVAIPVVFLVATATFFLVQLVPGSPAAAILGSSATKEQVAELTHRLGLDRPVWVQYGDWIGGALHGSFGNSFVTQQPVSDALWIALPPTLSIALLSTAVTLVAGMALGMLAAVRRGRTDQIVRGFSNLAMAIPNFWLAALLVFVFGVALAILPATGYTPITDDPLDWLSHLVLPVVALSLAGLAQIVFQARASTLEVLGQTFVRTLQAAGIPRRRLLFKHVLRNAAIPVTTVAGINFVFVLGGTVVIEAIFNMPGMGSLMLRSVQAADFSVVQAAVIYFSITVVLVNLIVDVVTAVLNPRLRIA